VQEKLKPSTLEAPPEKTRCSSNTFDGIAAFTTPMREIDAAHGAQFHAVELWPHALVRGELRGIGRQALQGHTRRCPMDEELPEGMAAVARCTIPDHAHAAGHLA
jgi:hypothetical protein